jgi:hypothetical protein
MQTLQSCAVLNRNAPTPLRYNEAQRFGKLGWAVQETEWKASTFLNVETYRRARVGSRNFPSSHKITGFLKGEYSLRLPIGLPYAFWCSPCWPRPSGQGHVGLLAMPMQLQLYTRTCHHRATAPVPRVQEIHPRKM